MLRTERAACGDPRGADLYDDFNRTLVPRVLGRADCGPVDDDGQKPRGRTRAPARPPREFRTPPDESASSDAVLARDRLRVTAALKLLNPFRPPRGLVF